MSDQACIECNKPAPAERDGWGTFPCHSEKCSGFHILCPECAVGVGLIKPGDTTRPQDNTSTTH